jgi:auxin-responsive protein IAA
VNSISIPNQTSEQKEVPHCASPNATQRNPPLLSPSRCLAFGMTPPPPLEARDYIGLGAAGGSSSTAASEAHLALRLGLPGSESPSRRAEAEDVDPALTLGCPAPAPALPRVAGAKRGFHDSRLGRPAGRAAGGFSGEEKGTGEATAGAPRAAK